MEEYLEDHNPKRLHIFSNEIVNLVQKDESKKLGLRKKFIDDYLNDLRKKERLKKKTKFEIDISKLSISQEYRNFNLTDINDKNQIQTLLFMLSSNNLPYEKFGVYLLRNHVCGYKSDSSIVFEKKEIYDTLIDLFLNKNDKRIDYDIKYEIYWILINSTENNDHLLSLINEEIFMQELEKDFSLNNENLNEMIIWLCCHLIQDSETFASRFSKTKIFNKTVENLSQKILKIDYVSSLTIQSLKLIHVFVLKAKNKVDQIPIDLMKDIVNIMLKFSNEMNHEEIRCHLLYTLNFLLDNDNNYAKALVLQDQQLLKNIINFNFIPEHKEIRLVIRIIGSLFRGNDNIVDYFLSHFNVIDCLLRYYKSSHNELIHQDILWSLSNLTAGKISHIMHFLSSEFYFIARDSLTSDNSLTQRFSLKIFNNIICMDFYEISIKIINDEFLMVLIKILSEKNSKVENKTVSLSLLDNIFLIGKFTKRPDFDSQTINSLDDSIYNIKKDEENEFIKFFLKNDGKEVLNDLQLDVSQEIYKKSKLIIEKYFMFEEQ